MKKKWIMWLVLVLAIVSCGVVYAVEMLPDTAEAEAYAEALAAGDVCAEHLLQNCEECGGVDGRATYRRICPLCEIAMTIYCNPELVAYDDLSAPCYADTHPDGCENSQDWNWNVYICDKCGYFERGSKEDDRHLESYYHTLCNCDGHYHGASDDAKIYCTTTKTTIGSPKGLVKLDDCAEHTYEEAVVAGDFCEVHGIFGCDIAIETDDE